MKEAKKFLFLFLFIFLISFISAQDIKVHVKTLPTHDIFASIVDIEGENYLQVLKEYSGYEGEAIFDFSLDNAPSYFKINILLKKQDVRVLNHQFDSVSGNEFYILIDEETQEIGKTKFWDEEIESNLSNEEVEINISNENEESENVIEESENSTDESQKITGQQISDLKQVVSNNKYYIILIVAVFLIVFGSIVFGRKVVNKKAKAIENSDPPIIFDENRIKEAEKKLKQAREELREMEGEIQKISSRKNKIEEAKKRLAADQEELDRLRRGTDNDSSFSNNISSGPKL
jgi:DNA repair exonuclease SbcCD ATPase subunit